MPRHFALALALVTSVHAIPLKGIPARDGVGTTSTDIGSQADGGSVAAEAASCSSTDCALSNLFDGSVLKVASGNGVDASYGAANEHSLLRLVSDSDSINTTGAFPKAAGLQASGTGDERKGGSTLDTHRTLIELDSDNTEQGSGTSSGNSSGLINQPDDVGQKGHKILTS